MPIKKYTVYLLLVVALMLLTGCKSSSREAFNTKMQEGEVLLQQEKFEEAVVHFKSLYEEKSDSITLMEKIEYAMVMDTSRKSLRTAEQHLDQENYADALEALEGVYSEDDKGMQQKEALLEAMKEDFLEKGKALLEKEFFDEALALIEEYQTLRGEDTDLLQLKEEVLAEKNKPEEPKKVVVINAGHQKLQDKDLEPMGPGSLEMKSRVTSGTRGSFTGVYEYELNLAIAVKLEKRLLEEGFLVTMVRTSHEVSLSNKERAELANAAGADLYLSLHANGSRNPQAEGISVLYASSENPFVAQNSEASRILSELLHQEMVLKTGAKPMGTVLRDDMTSLNWSQSPAAIVEVGYMTNEKEDVLLQTEEYQDKLVEGMVEGIKKYFTAMP